MKKLFLFTIICVCIFALASCVKNEQQPSSQPDVTDEPPVHVHTWIIDSAIESTCTENGLTEGKHCSECGEVSIAQKEVPLIPHTEEILYSIESTCTENGLTEGKKCSVCDKIIVPQNATPLKPHTEEVVPAVGATCTNTGLSEGKKCSICNLVLVEQQKTPIIAHIYDDKYDESCNSCGFIRDAECAHRESVTVEGYAATCTAAGLTDGSKCKKCGEILVNQTVIDVLPHTEVIDEEIFGGCLGGYWSQGSHCGYCGLILIPQEYYPVGHCESEWILDIEPTTQAEGSKHIECIWCGYVLETGTIDKVYSEGLYIEYRWESYDIYGYYVYGIGNCTDTYVSIPPTTDYGEPVIGIACWAFSESASITDVEIPSSIIYIDSDAFTDCTSLESIIVHENNPFYQSIDGCLYTKNLDTLMCYPTSKQNTSFDIPDSVVYIDDNFSSNDSLESITVGKKVSNIGPNTFSGCSSLKNISIDDNNPYYQSIDGNVYSKDGKTLIYYVSGKSDLSFTVPNSVTNIGEYAFYSNTLLESITIPNSVTEIGSSAFQGCTSLKSITLPDSITKIGSSAFKGCTSLESITLPNSVVDMEYSVFSDCTSLESIVIPNTWTYIVSEMFSGCTMLKNITIPNSITGIGFYAFADCTSLNSITIPDSVTEIGSSAFEGCSSLESITIPNSVTEIGSSAFEGCSSLKSITIPNYITRIADYTFANCILLETVEIPESLTNISSSAFAGCTNFKYNEYDNGYYLGNKDNPYLLFVMVKDENATNCVIHNDTKMIGSGAFSNNKTIVSVTIGNSVTKISDSMFNGCSSLKNVTFGSSINEIGSQAFCYCTALTSIVIPDTITSIGDSAFAYCYSLESAVIGNSVTEISDNMFWGCDSLKDITLSNSINRIGRDSFFRCTSLTSIVIPDSVATIDYYAFYACTALEYVTLGSGVYNFIFYDCYAIKSVDISENNPYYQSIDGNIYSKDGKMLIRYMPGKESGHFDVPKNVTSIASYAFENCRISSIKLPKNLSYIGEYAFKGCTSLSSIEIPEAVSYIGGYVFQDCYDISIYCEAYDRPYGWEYSWNYSVNENDYIGPGIYAEVELYVSWGWDIWYEEDEVYDPWTPDYYCP